VKSDRAINQVYFMASNDQRLTVVPRDTTDTRHGGKERRGFAFLWSTGNWPLLKTGCQTITLPLSLEISMFLPFREIFTK